MLGNRKFEDVTLEDLRALVHASYAEDGRIDYKRDLPPFDAKKPDDARKKFLADVVSFANASGGDILFGVDEGRDDQGQPNGILLKVVGVEVPNLDALQRRWMGIVETGLDDTEDQDPERGFARLRPHSTCPTNPTQLRRSNVSGVTAR